jgi:VWFA-related protein
MMARALRWIGLGLLVAAFAQAGVKDLPTKYQDWLEQVRPLITKAERKSFLDLEKDYQRDAFITRFWEIRDPVPETRINEFKERYESRLAEALALYESIADDRARVYALNGEPTIVRETDCGFYTWPLEIWRYRYADAISRPALMVFYQRSGGGPFRIWNVAEGHAALLPTIDPALSLPEQRNAFHLLVQEYCGEIWDETAALLRDLTEVERELGTSGALAAGVPKSNDPEWTASFRSFSTDVEADAKPLDAGFEVSFPGTHQSRTRVAGTLTVPAASVARAGAGETASYNFQLTGEVLLASELFESFRYRFDLPAARVRAEMIALDFERALRPAEYRWVLKLEDLNGGGTSRQEVTVTVPAVDGVEVAAGAAEETPAGAPSPVSVALTEPGSDVLSGAVRFTALVEGEGVAKVQFLLDGKPLLTKTRSPYSVDFNLGAVPRSHLVRVVAFAPDGRELATDERVVNPGQQSFLVRLVEPRAGAQIVGGVRARAEVLVPPGRALDRVEFWVGDQRAATLFQEPFVQNLEIGTTELAFLRVVGYLDDGSETEDLVVVNAPEFGENVEVRLVELYAAALDKSGAPVLDLAGSDFEVAENGVRQEIVRFDRLTDLPLYAGLMIDTSASMAEHFEAVNRIGRAFLEESIRPQDKAAVITFSDGPRLAAAFTNDMAVLSSALGGLRAERGTALWDSLVFAIDYFRGIKGQRALVLLSDGEDRRSQHTVDEVLQFAQNAGVTIYTVGLESNIARAGRGHLTRLAEQTGGRAFFLRSVEELSEAYAQIQNDLRSRYLLVYQSSAVAGDDFRAIEVEVAGRNLEVRTLRGYFP